MKAVKKTFRKPKSTPHKLFELAPVEAFGAGILVSFRAEDSVSGISTSASWAIGLHVYSIAPT